MSASSVVTLGYGSWGNINFVPTLGYGAYDDDTPVVPDVPGCATVTLEAIGSVRVGLEGIGINTVTLEKIGSIRVGFERCE